VRFLPGREACLRARGPICFRSLIRRIALSFVLAAALAQAARAENQADISADSIENDSTGDVIFRGEARLVDPGLVLTADEIRYNQKTRVATASGKVVMDRVGERLLADTLTYNRASKEFTATHLRTGRFPFYIEGPYAEGDGTKVVIHDATVTYNEPGVWQPTIKARVLTYSPGHYLRVSGGSIGIGRYRPLAVSRLGENLARQTSIWSVSVDGGYRHDLGPYLDTAVHVPVSPGLSVGPDLGIYTFRGIMTGPIANYDITNGDSTIQGYLKSGYIYDLGTKTTDILNNPIADNRAYVEWNHIEQVTPNLTLTGDINWSSDSEVVRDFHSKQFVPVQEPDNFLEANYTGDDYFATVFTRFQPDAFYPVQERLPEIRFDLLPTAVGGGIYVRFDSSVVHLEEHPPEGGALLKSNRFDTFLGLSRPFSFRGIADFTPVIGGRYTEYWNTVGALYPGGTSRALGEIGFDADLKMSATWDYENKLWHLDGIRHLLTPTLSYRYIPNADKSADWIPPIDRSTFTNYLPVLDLGNMRALDQLQAENVLRVGLNNTVQTRDKTYGSMNLLTFNLDDDIELHRAPGNPDFSDIHAELTATPARWLELRFEDSVSANRLSQKAIDTSMTVREGEVWSTTFGVGFLSDQYGSYAIPGLGSFPIVGVDIYHGEVRARINEAYQAFVRGDYDLREHQFVDQFYGITQKLSNTWVVEYAVVFSNGPNKEGGHFGFNTTVNIIRF
jgi:LPS-assembly protein